MDLADSSSWFFIPLQILFVDLLLGADNALLIALACRALPPRELRQAVALGISGAIVLRLLLTMVATSLLTLPLVKIVGALVLTLIALNVADDEEWSERIGEDGGRAKATLWSAAAVIVVADAAMSIDNVVALAAIARGNFWLLAVGVALSLPILAYGGVILTQLLRRAPGLVTFGAALLGWIAGGMAISDPLIAPWADANAPGLVAIAPALVAAFVYFQGRMKRVSTTAHPAPRPLPRAATLATPTFALARVSEPPRLAVVDTQFAEPEGRVEPPKVVANREDRIAIIGVLLLAVVAGVILMAASYLDSFN